MDLSIHLPAYLSIYLSVVYRHIENDNVDPSRSMVWFEKKQTETHGYHIEK